MRTAQPRCSHAIKTCILKVPSRSTPGDVARLKVAGSTPFALCHHRPLQQVSSTRSRHAAPLLTPAASYTQMVHCAHNQSWLGLFEQRSTPVAKAEHLQEHYSRLPTHQLVARSSLLRLAGVTGALPPELRPNAVPAECACWLMPPLARSTAAAVDAAAELLAAAPGSAASAVLPRSALLRCASCRLAAWTGAYKAGSYSATCSF